MIKKNEDLDWFLDGRAVWKRQVEGEEIILYFVNI